MKHILFVITSFRHGGINKSLENLLSLINIKNYCVDVFVMEHYGPYITMLPNCNILKKDIWIEALIAKWGETKGLAMFRCLFVKSSRIILKYINCSIADFLFKNRVRYLGKAKAYDTVVAYSEGVPTIFTSFFEKSNKVAWIHCDYSSYLKLNKQPDETTVYNLYNSVVCVSEHSKKKFKDLMPLVKSQLYSIHNILNVSFIFEQSKKKIIDYRFIKGPFNIISIGRNDSIKRVYIIPKIVRCLVDRGLDFKWYLIGPMGNQQFHNELLSNIKKYNVENFFIWLGAKDNPYPYIVNSDLLVNVSISEACPYVINEAKVLHIPIVCTNFGSAPEFIENDVNGVIATIEQFADKIEVLISDKTEYKRLKNNILKYKYDNDKILKDIYMIL